MLQQAHQRHLEAAEGRWSLAVSGMRALLTGPSEEDARLARAFLMARDNVLFSAMGGGGRGLNSFGFGGDLTVVLGMVIDFISYQINDDGTPAVGYMTYTRCGYELAGPDSARREPYFCQDADWLRQHQPGAVLVGHKEAHEVLEWHAARDRRRIERMRNVKIEMLSHLKKEAEEEEKRAKAWTEKRAQLIEDIIAGSGPVLDAEHASYTEEAQQHWTDSLERAAEIFSYREENVRTLARLILTAHETTLHNVFGGLEQGFDIKLMGYDGFNGDLTDLFYLVRSFIGHDLLDDGWPGIGHYRAVGLHEEDDRTFVRCGPDHPDAMPYFCRFLDWLREGYPEATYITVESAIATIEFHEAKRREALAGMAEDNAEDAAEGREPSWQAEDMSIFRDSLDMKFRAAVYEDIIRSA